MDNFNWGNFSGSIAAPQMQQQSTVSPRSQGLLGRIVSGITQPFVTAGKAAGNTFSSMYGAATGNKLEEQNANQANTNIFGNTAGSALKKYAGTELGLGATLLSPETEGMGLLGKVGVGAAQGGAFGAGAGLANNLRASDILKSGLLGAGTGGLVGLGSGILGGIANKAESKLASSAAARNAAAAAEDVAPYKNVAAGADVQGMTNLMKDQLGVNDISPGNVTKTTGLLTGPNGFINGTKQQLIASAPDVNIDGMGDTLQKTMAAPENSAQLGDPLVKGTPGNNLYNSMLGKVQNLLGSPNLDENGLINTTHASSEDVFNEIQKTEGTINSLSRADPGTLGAAQRNVLQAYRNELMTRLSQGTGLNDTIENYTVPPEDVAAIHDAVSKAGLPPSVAEYGIKAINDAKSLSDLRAAEAPLVKASQLADDAQKFSQGPGFIQDTNKAAGLTAEGEKTSDVLGKHGYQNIRLGGMAAGSGARAILGAGALAARGIQSVANNDVVPGLINKVAGIGDTIPGEIASAASNAATVPAAVSAAGIGQPQATASDATQTPNASTTPQFNAQTGKIEMPQVSGANNPGATTSGTSDTNNSFGVSQEAVAQAMMTDMQSTGGKNLGKLKTIYDMIGSQSKANTPKLPQAGINQLNSVQAATKGLQDLKKQFSNTGLTGGPIGLISTVASHLPGGPASIKNIDTQINTLLPDVMKSLGLGISSAEQKQVKSLLPTTQDTTTVAKAKIDNVINQINAYATQYFNNQDNYSGVNSGTSSVLDSIVNNLSAATQ